MSVANEVERDIHRRLLAGDRVASVELAEAYLAPVRARLRQRFRGVRDDTLIEDAVTDAVMNYVERPAQYDPERMSLLSYLVMSAAGDLRNAQEREQRRMTRFRSLVAVEHQALDRNMSQDDVEAEVLERISALGDPRRQELLRRLRDAFHDPRDWRLLRLYAGGEMKTEAWARILEIEHLPKPEQQKQVKRHKDRIEKRLKRLGA